MNKVVKILAWLAGILVLLLIALVVVIPMVVDPNDYKGLVVDKVKETTGRELKIEEDLSLSVFPWVGIETGGVELGNAEGFGPEPFARIDHLAVSVKVWPLLSSRLEVGEVVLSGLQLHLAKNANGVGNWEDLAAGADEPQAPPQAPDDERGAGLADLSVGALVVDSGGFKWDDRSANQSLAISGFNLNTGAIRFGEPVDFTLAFAVDNRAPRAKGNLELKGRAVVDPARRKARLEGVTLTLDVAGEALQGGSLDLELVADLSVDGVADLVEMPSFRVEASFAGGPIAGEPVKLAMTSALSMQPQAGTAELRDFKLDLAGIQATGALTASQLKGSPAFQGGLEVAPFDARAIAARHGVTLPPMADASTLTSISANLNLKGSMQGGADATALNLRLDPLAVTLDQSTLQGHALVAGDHKGFELTLDQIDVDRYLPPPQQGAGAEAEPSPAPEGEAQPAGALIPVETLRGLDVKGKFTIGELKVAKLTLRQALIELLAKDGEVTVEQRIGELYQGRYESRTAVDVRGEEPRLSVQQKLSDVQIGPLLKDMTGDDKLLGTGGFSADLTTRGNSVEAFKQGLNGRLDFMFRDGAVKGFNLAQILRSTRAAFQGQGAASSGGGDQPKRTDFSEMQGSATISDGVLTNRDFSAKSPLIRVTGDGTVNVVAESLDYTVTATLVNSLKGQGGEGLEELVGVPIPLNLNGPWAKPDYKIEWGKVLVGTQKEKLKQKLNEKIMEKIQGGDAKEQRGSGGGSAAESLIRSLF